MSYAPGFDPAGSDRTAFERAGAVLTLSLIHI